MAILSVTSFVTLDGVMQAPGAPQEDASGGFTHGGWLVPHFDADMGAFMVDIFSRADAFLLGRGTWQIFASHWPHVKGDPIANPLNALPKHVATRTLTTVDWAGSTIVRDPIAEIAVLKETYSRELQVHGSPGLVQSLLAAGVVDELNVLQFPVMVGKGKRLYHEDCAPKAMQLLASRTTGTGAVMSRYRLNGPVVVGALELAT